MASSSGPPPGLTRPKSSEKISPLLSSFPLSSHSTVPIASPTPRRAASAAWGSSIAGGLFPPGFDFPELPPQVPQGIQPLSGAVQTAEGLCQPLLFNNTAIKDLAVFPAPSPSDPWHIAHARVCAHAAQACAACSAAFICCSCRALRFTPGTPPLSAPSLPLRHSRSSSPTLFRDVGNGPSPLGFDDANTMPDDDAYARALAECDTCDNSSCPRGNDEPATWTITVQQFDEGAEEHYDRTYRACGACNWACKRSFMGLKIQSHIFDNSTRVPPNAPKETPLDRGRPSARLPLPLPQGSPVAATVRPNHDAYATATAAAAASETPLGAATALRVPSDDGVPTIAPLDFISTLQDTLRSLNERPPTPVAFVAAVRIKHDTLCVHQVDTCTACSNGLVCCSCRSLFNPAATRHLKCTNCKHVAHTCCTTGHCCRCGKLWMPSDLALPVRGPARCFLGGVGSNSSPEPDIWTPSPRSSPDEIDDLTARGALPLPASRSESDASRAPSRVSSVDEPVNVAATPLPTPDYSSLKDEDVDGFIHESFPDRALLDASDKRRFLGRGDLSITSLKLYTRCIFTDTTHWITAGHFLIDIFGGSTLKGSRDDFRHFVILVGT